MADPEGADGGADDQRDEAGDGRTGAPEDHGTAEPPPSFESTDAESDEDCTFFLRRTGESGALGSPAVAANRLLFEYLTLPFAKRRKPRYSVASELSFRHPSLPNGVHQPFVARGLACLADRRAAVSVTVRSVKAAPGQQTDPAEAAGLYKLKPARARRKGAADVINSAFQPPTSRRDLSRNKNNWFSIRDQCEVLGRCVFRRPGGKVAKEHGLVVITGATNSAKSLVARGLIHDYLLANVKQQESDASARRPHLVTFEDPIESFFAVLDEEKLAESAKQDAEAWRDYHALTHPELAFHGFGIDYTPREKGRDVRDLGSAFSDALRQTPATFYVGEVRDPEDWKAVLEFAGTGHLVVTTAHAGSLVEAMIKLLGAVGARTPADRRRFGERILAVVHMQWVPAADAGERNLLLPAVWRRSDYGLTNLVAAGLGSVVPKYPPAPAARESFLLEGGRSSVGRRFLLDRLVEQVEGDSSDGAKDDRKDLQENRALLTRKAIELDIKGA